MPKVNLARDPRAERAASMRRTINAKRGMRDIASQTELARRIGMRAGTLSAKMHSGAWTAEDLAALDKYSDEKERLEAGMKLLMSNENVKKLSGSTATYAELCDAAEEYFASQIDSANDEAWWADVLTAALTVTVVLALISLLLWQFVRSSGAAAIIAGVSAVAALVCGVLWHNHCPADGTLAFAAGLTLCLIAVVCTDLMAHRAKEASAVPASSVTAN